MGCITKWGDVCAKYENRNQTKCNGLQQWRENKTFRLKRLEGKYTCTQMVTAGTL